MPHPRIKRTALTGSAAGFLAGFMAGFAGLLAGTSLSAAEPAPTVQAIRKQQQIRFYFQSFTTFYSCDGLEGKLERILRELGAEAKVAVRSADCPTSVARTPHVILDVTSPVEATPQALAELEKGKSTRELAARAKGKRAEYIEGSASFPAQWRRVSLTRGQLGLEPGDCELIEELRRKVLPKLAVRVVKDDVRCTPNQVTLGQPRLEVEALVELPKPDEKNSTQTDQPALPTDKPDDPQGTKTGSAG